MIIYVDSTYNHIGSSTLSYILTKLYGNLLNQKSVAIGLGCTGFVETATALPEEHEFPGIQMMVNKTGGAGSFMSSCFKLEETVYYYGAKAVGLQTEGDKDLVRRLLRRAKADFGFVVVDGGCKANSFTDVAESVDKVIVVAPPDLSKAKITHDNVIKALVNYENSKGVAFKPELIYVVPKYDGIPSRTKLQQRMNSTAKDTAFLRYSKKLHDYRNSGDLDMYLSDILAGSKNEEGSLIIADFRNLLKMVTNIKLPTVKVKKEVLA
jgi:hypothetical protein